MKITRLKNGQIVVEARASKYEAREFGTTAMPDTMEFTPDDWRTVRAVRVGDEGCVGIATNVSPDSIRDGHDNENFCRVYMTANPEGISGNSNHHVRRLHGWRGTTNDSSIEADGWRRVLEIRPTKTGIGWRVVLSEDLNPTAV